MIAMKKPAPGGNREAGSGNARNSSKHTPIRTLLKAAIVNLTVWSLIPTGVTTWLIQRGGMSDA
jgi:hypothetical protein